MDIEIALTDHLLEDQNLSALIGDRVFPLVLPQENKTIYPDGVTPAVVWQRISSPRALSLSGETANNPRFQFSGYADDLMVARQIADALNQSLDFFAGTLGGRTKAQVLRADYRDSYEHETGLYRSDVDFFILHNKKG